MIWPGQAVQWNKAWTIIYSILLLCKKKYNQYTFTCSCMWKKCRKDKSESTATGYLEEVGGTQGESRNTSSVYFGTALILATTGAFQLSFTLNEELKPTSLWGEPKPKYKHLTNESDSHTNKRLHWPGWIRVENGIQPGRCSSRDKNSSTWMLRFSESHVSHGDMGQQFWHFTHVLNFNQ